MIFKFIFFLNNFLKHRFRSNLCFRNDRESLSLVFQPSLKPLYKTKYREIDENMPKLTKFDPPYLIHPPVPNTANFAPCLPRAPP